MTQGDARRGEHMDSRLAFDRTVVAVDHGDDTVNVMVEVTAPEIEVAERRSVDSVIVIDRSGSMSGQKLRSVIAAVTDILRRKPSSDRIGVVTFDSSADIVSQLDTDPHTAITRVNVIRSGGSTNLSAGWFRAQEMLANSGRPDTLKRIIVLTDGHVNAGIADRDDLAQMMSRGLSASVSTSLIGFGDGYDELMLRALADAGQGNEYFCEGPDQAAAVFNDEFGGLAKVVGQNLTFNLETTPAVAAVEVLNDFPTTGDGSRVCVSVGDIYSGETRNLVLRLSIRPQRALGPVDLGVLRISWASVIGVPELRSQEIPITINAGLPGEHDLGADPRVRDEVIVLEAARDRLRVKRQAESGDVRGAVDGLRSIRDRLSTVAGQEDQVDELALDIADIERRGWSPRAAKKSMTDSRQASRKRQSSYLSDKEGWDEDTWDPFS